MKKRKTVSALILLLAAILMITGLSSCKDPEPDPLTDEEALRGQWAVYELVEEPDTGDQTGTETEAIVPGTQEKERFAEAIIDIQYTKPGYWFMGYVESKTDPENIKVLYDIGAPAQLDITGQGFYIESKRTQEEDGWFVVSLPALPEGEIGEMKIRYKFADEERNTMEAEVIFPENEGSLKCIMRRLNHVIEILPLSEAENPEEGEETSPTT